MAKKYPDALVMGADTLVCLDAALFGKPATLVRLNTAPPALPRAANNPHNTPVVNSRRANFNPLGRTPRECRI